MKSLPEVHGSVPIPHGAGFWRKLIAFAGPGYLVAVGYMDPGNWATDIAGGARFGYTLLSVVMISNLMAILLQALSARLGIASGRDLAQAEVTVGALAARVEPRGEQAHGSHREQPPLFAAPHQDRTGGRDHREEHERDHEDGARLRPA